MSQCMWHITSCADGGPEHSLPLSLSPSSHFVLCTPQRSSAKSDNEANLFSSRPNGFGSPGPPVSSHATVSGTRRMDSLVISSVFWFKERFDLSSGTCSVTRYTK
jgi:hypothetical protein